MSCGTVHGLSRSLTSVEVLSAFRTLVLEQGRDEERAVIAERRLDELVRACHVVVDVAAVKRLASRLLRFHPLRAFDALQLGAALLWAEGHPEGRTLHTLDTRLGSGAEREGFVVPRRALAITFASTPPGPWVIPRLDVR